MGSYEIIMTPDATADLVELRDYITYVLLVPEIALAYIRAIHKEISKLEYSALSIATVPEEPWHSRGIRKIIAKNFYIYYRVDEHIKRVYILNIIYNKRDQLQALKNIAD